MTSAETSNWRLPRPCTAEDGKAWWLLCQASPSEGSASTQLLRLSSRTSKSRRPNMWQIEFTLQVMCWNTAIRTSPPQIVASTPPRKPSEQVADGERDDEAERDPDEVEAVDVADDRVLEQVAAVLGAHDEALRAEQPADVRMPEPAHDAHQPRAAADVRRMRVALDVGVRVVLAMVGDPLADGTLRRHRAEHGEQRLDGTAGLEAAMREVAVEPDRDAEAGDEVEEPEEDQVDRADGDAPERGDDGQDAERRRHDGEQRDDAVRGRRAVELTLGCAYVRHRDSFGRRDSGGGHRAAGDNHRRGGAIVDAAADCGAGAGCRRRRRRCRTGCRVPSRPALRRRPLRGRAPRGRATRYTVLGDGHALDSGSLFATNVTIRILARRAELGAAAPSDV